jgi:hypothetical protein
MNGFWRFDMLGRYEMLGIVARWGHNVLLAALALLTIVVLVQAR